MDSTFEEMSFPKSDEYYKCISYPLMWNGLKKTNNVIYQKAKCTLRYTIVTKKVEYNKYNNKKD